MKGDINLKLNKKTALFLFTVLGIYAFADFVSIVDTKSTGGITVTGGMTETEVNTAIQTAVDAVKAEYDTKINDLEAKAMAEIPIGTVAMWG